MQAAAESPGWVGYTVFVRDYLFDTQYIQLAHHTPPPLTFHFTFILWLSHCDIAQTPAYCRCESLGVGVGPAGNASGGSSTMHSKQVGRCGCECECKYGCGCGCGCAQTHRCKFIFELLSLNDG